MSNPTGPRELTPEWLTAVLRASGIIKNATVAAIDVQPLNDTGMTSQLARLRLTYRDNEDGIPASIISKFSTTIPTMREGMRILRTYEREVRFYQEIAPTAAVRTPRCYYSLFVPETLEHILLLEDISPARAGSALAGCTLDEAELIIREIAKFHAVWWNNAQLAQKKWLVVPEVQQQFQEHLRQDWPSFLERAGDLVPDEMGAIGEKLLDHFLTVTNPLYEAPLTILHRDFQLDNIFFEVAGQPGTLAVIDWQFVTVGRGVFDVGYFLASNVQSVDRKAKEIALLHIYHDVLVANGVSGYSFENALEDYRRALLSAFVQHANVMGMGFYDNNLEAVRQTFIPRSVAAVLDLNCGALI